MNQINQSKDPVDKSRRDILKGAFQAGAVTVGAFALAGCDSSSPVAASDGAADATVLPTGNYRVDVHCHHIPDFYRVSLAENGIVTAGGIPIPPWTPELAVAFMDEYGIQMQVLSISEPGVYYLSDAGARNALAMQINDYTSNLIKGVASVPLGATPLAVDPLLTNRFGGFAVLPLGDLSVTDVLNASVEATRALTTLGLDGVGLYTNYNGVYLGDPRLTPLLATLDALGAMVFLHPVLPGGTLPNVLTSEVTFLYEFPFDTTRAVVNMLYSQVFTAFPNIRWLIAHAGGCVPFLSYRTGLLTLFPALGQNLNAIGVSTAGALNANGPEAFANLFYDTALSPAPCAMQSVRSVTDVSHIMFATDWPFSAPVFVVPGDPAPQLAESFTKAELLKVGRDNQYAQFPRIKAALG